MRWKSSSRALLAALVVLLWFVASMSASAAELLLTVSAGTLSNGHLHSVAPGLANVFTGWCFGDNNTGFVDRFNPPQLN